MVECVGYIELEDSLVKLAAVRERGFYGVDRRHLRRLTGIVADFRRRRRAQDLLREGL